MNLVHENRREYAKAEESKLGQGGCKGNPLASFGNHRHNTQIDLPDGQTGKEPEKKKKGGLKGGEKKNSSIQKSPRKKPQAANSLIKG